MTVWLPLHVFAVVTFGGVLLGAIVQSVLGLRVADRKFGQDQTVGLSLLWIGMPLGVAGLAAGFVIADGMHLGIGEAWVFDGLAGLVCSLVLASVAAGLSLMSEPSERLLSFRRVSCGCLIVAWLAWLGGLVSMVLKGSWS